MFSEKLFHFWNKALWTAIPSLVLGGAAGFFFDVAIQGTGLMHAYAPASMWVAVFTAAGFAAGTVLTSYVLGRGQEERFDAFQKQVHAKASQTIQNALGDASK